ncbi:MULTISPECIES: hypothetical protein [Pseudomonas]|uniref:hypothetical protein n=1 Tax=Pseudomonas TaxID=286 RepID=UPI001E634807|nr:MULTISPECIES: hypothetical protein [Pseudomonas]MCE1118391.1 hypothetical protein [Pseudomonas sp. NMI795_08]
MLSRSIPAMLTLVATLLLGACATAPQPPAPPLGPVLPDTAQRSQWIEQTLAQDPLVKNQAKPTTNPSSDETVAKLRKERNLPLPDDYWALYKQNLDTFRADMQQQKVIGRAAYIAVYTDQLSRADDQTLQRLATAPDSLDKTTGNAWSQRMIERLMNYFASDNQATIVTLKNHMQRMALMDRQYKVCALYSDCWDKPSAK